MSSVALRGLVQFGGVLSIDDKQLVLHAGHSLNEAHFATKISLDELQHRSGISDPTEPASHDFSIDVEGYWTRDGWGNSFPKVRDRLSHAAREEEQSAAPERAWTKLNRGQGDYWVDRTNPENVAIQIKFKLNGADELVREIRALEDEMEKHLAIAGVSVDIEFRDRSGMDVHEIDVVDWGKTNHLRWNPLDAVALGAKLTRTQVNAQIFAHEVMHHFDLPDEYGFWDKIFGQIPPDAEQGIMADFSKKPLRRHFDEAIAGQTREPSLPPK